MLAEMLLYRLTPAAPWADAMGWREGAVRLWSRRTRCAAAWAPHLANTRRFVAEAAAAAPGRRTALVLGSGLLADLPIGLLATRFARVVLADVVHLPTVRWRTRRWKNVEHATVDLTGTAAALAAGASPPAPGSRFGLDDPTVDFVVSLNLVSQLPLGPVDWLTAKGGCSETEAAAYGARVVAAHFAHLRGFAAPVCVIGDRSRTLIARDGTVIETEDALFGVPPPPEDDGWDWDLAPHGEEDRAYAVRNRVFAIRELRAESRLV
jgi:hypothetical protein